MLGVIITERRLIVAASYSMLAGLAFFGLRHVGPPMQENLGVFDETVGDGGSNRRVEQNVSPFGKNRVGRNNRAATLCMSCRDYLVKQVGSLLIQGKISKFVTNQEPSDRYRSSACEPANDRPEMRPVD